MNLSTRHRAAIALTAVVALLAIGAPAVAQDVVTNGDDQAGSLPTQAYLGLGVGPLHPALTNQLGDVIGKGRGVLIEKVMRESPAAKAGLQQYDVLVSFNDQDLYSPEQLVKLVRNAKPGSEVTLKYVRGGKVHEAKVTLGEAPAQEPVRSRRAFRLPLAERLLQPDGQLKERPSARDGAQSPRRTPWGAFQSLTIAKQPDGTYKVEIDYRDAKGKQIHREFVGTREEIKEAVEADKDLPDAERQHLLRSLDQHEQPVYVFPWLEEWNRELFNWPHLDF